MGVKAAGGVAAASLTYKAAGVFEKLTSDVGSYKHQKVALLPRY